MHGAFFIVNQLVQYSAALALGLAWRASSGGAGQRLAWLFWATGGLYIVTAAGVVLAVSGVWPAFNRWQFAAFDLVLLASFSALAYAVLRHRVFQFGVVVQRALAFSIVATETSTLTIIGTPAIAYGGNLTFLQLVFGYLIGRVLIVLVLLPGYFRGDFFTAYALIEKRFGQRMRAVAASTFLITRAIAEGVTRDYLAHN